METILVTLTKLKEGLITIEVAEERIYNNIRKQLSDLNKEHREEIKEMRGKYREEIKENCDHEFGRIEWHTACNGTKTCRKCGYNQDVYERD